MSKNALVGHVLGVDIGTKSVGWALLSKRDKNWEGITATGVRIFPQSIEGDFSKGRDVSKSQARRAARQRRRLLKRRVMRLILLAKELQRAGLLPEGDVSSSQGRQSLLNSLDNSIFPEDVRRREPQTLLYGLRTSALDEKLTPYALGRTFYHLAQRRGFNNSRLPSGLAKKPEERGIVKSEIRTLEEKMRAANTRTLGEYFRGLDPHEERIRTRHTSRAMYEEEFRLIWSAQKNFHPEILTDPLRQRLHRIIFRQRPLKSSAHLIGQCSFERGRHRAPMALLSAQRFRLLQKINDIRWWDTRTGEMGPLTEEMRLAAVDILEREMNVSWTQLKKRLGFDKSIQFNFEKEGDKKKLPGNRTAVKLREIFGSKWDGLDFEIRNRIVDDVLTIDNSEALARRGREIWELGEDQSARLGEIELEPGYCALSRQALKMILPLMENGESYARAWQKIWPPQPKEPRHFLPPLEQAIKGGLMPEVRNPVVKRCLNQLRKVINAVIRAHGKPQMIRVELAQDLKKSRDDRREYSSRQEENREENERAAKELLETHGIQNPSRNLIQKWILAQECKFTCPYTGREFSAHDVLGPHPTVDVEHIIPFDRSLDDSFLNKTLCDSEFNRNVKRNRTPWEAMGDTGKWDDMISRVKKFKGSTALGKLKRFLMKEIPADFASRQLNDTRYASRLAVQFLGILFGTDIRGITLERHRPVAASTGGITAHVRNELKLNKVLNDGEIKKRLDHRHHAVDAVAIALTDDSLVKALGDAAARARDVGMRRFAPLESPWPEFFDEVKSKIHSVVPSHAPQRAVNGPLHEETFYSRPHIDADGESVTHVRKRLDSLKEKKVEDIVDGAVRDLVRRKLADLGEKSPEKAFKDPSHLPCFVMKDGRAIPIKSVRIKVKGRPVPFGEGPRERHVFAGDNHHLEIWRTNDNEGRPAWEGKVVTRIEAMRRLLSKKPIIDSGGGQGRNFIFSLSGGDTVRFKNAVKEGIPDEIFVIRTIYAVNNKPRISFVSSKDARSKEDIKNGNDGPKGWFDKSLKQFKEMDCEKVTVSPLSEISVAHD